MSTTQSASSMHLTTTRRTLLALSAAIAAGSRFTASSAQDQATPAADILIKVAEQVAELDGKDRLWQTNRVVVQQDDDEDFLVRLGFAYAHEISVELDFDGNDDDNDDGIGDDVTLAIGEGVAIRNRDDIEAEPVGTSIGSFYTLELIDPEDADNTENRLAIGTPFPTEASDYTLTLWSGNATAGSTISFGEGATNGLVLLIKGTLIYTRENDEATTLAPGEAASGAGAGQVEAGDDGASFVVVTLTQGNATS